MSGGSGGNRNECRIYVGNLPPDIRTKDIQDLFYKFGKVTFVDLKNRKGPPFAFVEFEDPRWVLFNYMLDFADKTVKVKIVCVLLISLLTQQPYQKSIRI